MRVEVKNGCYTYPKATQRVLNDISFKLDDAQIMTILGKNGIGKTTLLKCMSGMFKWESGVTFINDKEFTSINDIKTVAFVPQAHAQTLTYPYSVIDMVTMGRVRYMGALSIPSKQDVEYAWQALETVGMQDYAQRACTQLSGGQLQMVFIARALTAQPEMLIMDEPESHLDIKNQYRVIELVEELKEEQGISSIINTHYPEHALRISDKVLMLGRDDFIFGGKEVITPENMRKYFDVNADVRFIEENEKKYESFVIFGTTDNEVI